MTSKLRETLDHLQTFGISCGTYSKEVDNQGCLLTALALQHGVTWEDIQNSIYGCNPIYEARSKDHAKDLQALADVIREQYPDWLRTQIPYAYEASWTSVVVFRFNDHFVASEPERIIQVCEKAAAKREEEEL